MLSQKVRVRVDDGIAGHLFVLVSEPRGKRHFARRIEQLSVERVDGGERARLSLEVDARLQQPRVFKDGEELNALDLAILRHDRKQARRVVHVRDVADEHRARRRRGDALVVHRALDAENDGLILLRDEHHFSVQPLQGAFAVGFVFVLNETVSAGSAAVNVDHHAGGNERPEGAEPGEEKVVVDRHREVRDVEVGQRLKEVSVVAAAAVGGDGAGVGVGVGVGAAAHNNSIGRGR